MPKKTKFFQNCLGVFQGGGCKGSAYIGAYKEALRWGVSFSEVVGASAGSIIAVFIGAGASPEQLEEFITQLDFKMFLKDPRKLEKYSPPRFSQVLRFIPFSVTRKYHKIFTHLGLYDSEFLKTWIDNKLSQLLPDKPRPIKFKDLIIPTSVIVSDIVTRKIEVYSQETSLNKDVCEAVQSSCNIPFFFQPIEMRYVDGGLLSNLPSFIFHDRSEKLYNRILAFSLESDQKNEPFFDFAGFSKALLNTTLEGNLDLQLGLQNDLHIIKINTGDISSTDFDKITPETIRFLITQGENATKDFFESEILKIHTRINDVDISKDNFNTNNFIVQTIDYKYNEIVIADITTEWVYELFPTLLRWKFNGSAISFLLQNGTDDPDHSPFRIRFLKALGINVFMTDNIPLRGFIFDGDIEENCLAIILNKDYNNPEGFHSRLYRAHEDFSAIKTMREKIISQIKGPFFSLTKTSLEKVDNIEILNLIKTVKQYNNSHVQITIQDVEISKAVFITRYVRGFKYRQIHNLFDLYSRFGIEHFVPAKLNLLNGKYTLITPPVVEKIANNYYVIEGSTRLTFAYRNGIISLRCIVIEGVRDPLPSNGEFRAKEILLSDKLMIGGQRYENFDFSNFRNIEKAVRNPTKCLL